MDTTQLRTTATRILDGMTFNRNKLANDCLQVCSLADRLASALADERKKVAQLTAELEQARRSGSSNAEEVGLGPEFDDIFRDALREGMTGKHSGGNPNPYK